MKILLTIIIALTQINCGLFEKTIFDDDVPSLNTNRVHITKENLPKPGITTESELHDLFQGYYCKRFSYVFERRKVFDNKSITFNRIYHYIETVNQPIKGPGYWGHLGLERKFLTIFALNGIIQDFVIIHKIKKKAGSEEEWQEGPLTNFNLEKYQQDWPDASRDLYDYYTQPGKHETLDQESLKAILRYYDKRKDPVKTYVVGSEKK
ncbi:hypothetical protein EHQ81_06350 [Leptospira selangorensis]|uniref:Uncharacterized protein n=1 Tax=Leptospira selangorensis TaxID=2484982 RepID=A0A5F2C2D3_9LEPT|nr:hypothetical protein [Leptospira selangorensis]TGM16007.1 hypothetical protein EHQ81_06350 [Leptospira selangorensis]TGM18043.1 hypothetical protein EHQ82_13355 [Leptospira selangorensis]